MLLSTCCRQIGTWREDRELVLQAPVQVASTRAGSMAMKTLLKGKKVACDLEMFAQRFLSGLFGGWMFPTYSHDSIFGKVGRELSFKVLWLPKGESSKTRFEPWNILHFVWIIRLPWMWKPEDGLVQSLMGPWRVYRCTHLAPVFLNMEIRGLECCASPVCSRSQHSP